MKKIIIIGAAAAGMTFAAKLSRAPSQFEHVVYEKRHYASLGACGIPFVVGGQAPHGLDDLIVRSVDQHQQNGINLKVKHEVKAIDFKAQTVQVQNLTNGQTMIDKYDELIIATGAQPKKFPWPNGTLDHIFTATTYEDAAAWTKITTNKQIRNIVIIGGGLIGLEMAENLTEQGKVVTIIEATSHVGTTFDPSFSDAIKATAKTQGLTIKCDESVTSFEGKTKVTTVITDQSQYPVDAVLVAIGFVPNTHLFKNTPLKLNPQGAIVINHYGQTNVPHVWAAGDCATIFNNLLHQDVYTPLATVARQMATVIFEHLVHNKQTPFGGTIGSSGIRFFDQEFFQAGLNEKWANYAQIDYHTTTITSQDAAGYSGQARPLTLKLFADDQQIIIGAQASGSNRGAALRIALLISAITKRMNLTELAQLDLFYTPPFTRATDIVHIAARTLKKQYNTSK